MALACSSSKKTSVSRATAEEEAQQEPDTVKEEHSTQAFTELEPGVFTKEVVLNRAGSSMRVWLYAPSATVDTPVGCVVVPPAGSNLISGMRLGDGDRPEHLPYVKAGFVVVSFDIDGALSEAATDLELIESMAAFRDAKAGVENASAALDAALVAFPTIDSRRIYTSGHSSAGTLALLFAASDDRIQAVAAFAPVIDVLSIFPADFPASLELAMPGFIEFLKASSPAFHAKELTAKPVFLFYALDDDGVEPQEMQTFSEQAGVANTASKLRTVASGGHYDSMMQEGLPQAISWFSTL